MGPEGDLQIHRIALGRDSQSSGPIANTQPSSRPSSCCSVTEGIFNKMLQLLTPQLATPIVMVTATPMVVMAMVVIGGGASKNL